MPKKIALPKYRKQAGSNGADRAFCELAGRRVYLGLFGSPESHEAYDRTLAEWLVSNRRPLRREEPAPAGLTVVELLAAWDKHADGWYRTPSGQPSRTKLAFNPPLRILRTLYGRTQIADFDPRSLKAVRQRMISEGWARVTINDAVGRIKTVFSWGVSENLVPAEVVVALRTLRGLMPGKSEARESDPIRPVAIETVEATIPFLTDTVADMVRVQLLTGMRSGELVTLRPNRIDMSGAVWLYRPRTHKTQHHGREGPITPTRRILFAARALSQDPGTFPTAERSLCAKADGNPT